MSNNPITIKGYNKLKEEFDTLKTVERPAIIAAINEAMAHGDYENNAKFHETHQKKKTIEDRIIEIEQKLSNSQVIDVAKFDNDGTVIFGATVELVDMDTDEKVTYQIVGEDEVDIQERRISIASTIGRTLKNKREGDEVTALTPRGSKEYKILTVKYI